MIKRNFGDEVIVQRIKKELQNTTNDVRDIQNQLNTKGMNQKSLEQLTKLNQRKHLLKFLLVKIENKLQKLEAQKSQTQNVNQM